MKYAVLSHATLDCSLIISTYNASSSLRLCLKSIENQAILPKEVIIADDGSTDDTKKVVDDFRENTRIPTIHVWQKNEGFRLAQIRNKAFAKASCDYIIQIDGDLILHPKFVDDHLYLTKENFFLTGARVLLSPETTKRLIEYDSIHISKHKDSNNTNVFNQYRNRFLSRLLADHYKQSGKNKYYVKGCNMSFWRKDVVSVNGYNEDLEGWGKEDNEIAVRLINKGIKKRFLKMGGVAYHLHHSFCSRGREEVNTTILQKSIDEKMIRAENGIDRYL